MSQDSRALWAKRVDRWKDSGLTAKEFAVETRVSSADLIRLSSKVRSREKGLSQRKFHRGGVVPALAGKGIGGFVSGASAVRV